MQELQRQSCKMLHIGRVARSLKCFDREFLVLMLKIFSTGSNNGLIIHGNNIDLIKSPQESGVYNLHTYVLNSPRGSEMY